jgi:hypothetical protein
LGIPHTLARCHIEQFIRPWLYQNGLLNDPDKIIGCYEDIELSAQWSLVPIVTEALPGNWQPPAMPAEGRREVLLATLTKAQPYTFTPAFQVDPGAELIAPALRSEGQERLCSRG